MKKLFLASAITAASIATVQAAPTIYGKAFITVDYVDIDLDYNNDVTDSRADSSSDSVQINSTTSRIGFRGSEAVTINTDVIYQLEYGIAVDGNESNEPAFTSRDTYLGLLNKKYGEFRFGRNYSVTDYVNNVSVNEGYWDNIGASGVNEDDSITNALTLTDGDRINNSIVWIAPKYEGLPLELALQYGADESFDNDKSSGFGASMLFDADLGVTVGIAYDQDMSIDGDILRGSGTVDLNAYTSYPVTLGVLYQQADYQGLDKEKGLAVSAQMNLDNFNHPTVAYVQYDTTKNIGGMTDLESDQLVVGAKYAYKDNIIAHGYAGYNSADLNGTDADVMAIGGGLEYLF